MGIEKKRRTPRALQREKKNIEKRNENILGRRYLLSSGRKGPGKDETTGKPAAKRRVTPEKKKGKKGGVS